MKFGILSFDMGESHDVTDIVKYGIKAEEAGLGKFWLGEHYGQILWSNPEPLIPVILGMTETITVGIAGILIDLHSAYRVALSFKLMNSLFPGRVDLGIAKGSTTEEYKNLMYDHKNGTSNTIIEKIDNLFHFFENEEKFVKDGITIPPSNYPNPNLWMLGLSYNSINFSLDHKCGFSRSLFHSSAIKTPLKLELLSFTEKFNILHSEQPKINVAISGVIGKSTKDAKYQFEKSVWNGNEFIIPNFLGDRYEFEDYIYKLQDEFGVNEIIFLDLSPTIRNKFDSLEVFNSIISNDRAF